jgi:hypothetical protein
MAKLCTIRLLALISTILNVMVILNCEGLVY